MKKIILAIIILLLTVGCAKLDNEDILEKEDEIVEEEIKKPIKTSFVAVGDNLIHGGIYLDPLYANNNYDFTPIYENIKPYIKEADIAYINQETMLGGHELGLSGYPMFNSPQEIGDAVVDAGFDWINHATNHTLDKGEVGVIKTLEYWDTKSNILTTGIARSNEEQSEAKIFDRDGVRFGLLAYTYGTNGIPVPSGKEYLVNLIDPVQIEADVKALEGKVDSILVSMHWGTEYSYTPNEQQEETSQLLADLGVDVIIGTHPHVIQPMEWKNGKDGNKTLVIYSLGNFLSAQDVNYRMLGGMANFDIVFDPNTNQTKVEAVTFTPTINYFSSGFRNFNIYRLKDYTNEIAKTHGLSSSFDVSKEYFNAITEQVMGDEFEIIY